MGSNIKKEKNKTEITIGADPEFLLVNNEGKVRRAKGYAFFNHMSSHDKIGCDGGQYPVEIRPSPVPISKLPLMLTEIDTLLRQIGSFCIPRKLKLIGGAVEQKYSIGGHIHFGSSNLKNKKPNEKLLDLLDILFTPLTNLLLPASQIKERVVQRGYGRLNSMEKKKYGFEYRTPYCFLMSPSHTAGFFALAALIAAHYRKTPVDKRLLDRVNRYYTRLGDVKLCRSIYKDVKPKLLRLMKFKSPNPSLNSYILNLFNLIERKKQYDSMDIFKNYKIDPSSVLPIKSYNTKFIVSDDEYMDVIRHRIKTEVNNTSGGTVYIYGVKYRDGYSYCMKDSIFYSYSLPTLSVPNGISIRGDCFGEGARYENSIGISLSLRKKFNSGAKSFDFIINFLNRSDFYKNDGSDDGDSDDDDDGDGYCLCDDDEDDEYL